MCVCVCVETKISCAHTILFTIVGLSCATLQQPRNVHIFSRSFFFLLACQTNPYQPHIILNLLFCLLLFAVAVVTVFIFVDSKSFNSPFLRFDQLQCVRIFTFFLLLLLSCHFHFHIFRFKLLPFCMHIKTHKVATVSLLFIFILLPFDYVFVFFCCCYFWFFSLLVAAAAAFRLHFADDYIIG